MSSLKPPKKQRPSNKRNHVLIYGDFGCVTGFANVTENIVKNVKEKLGKSTIVHIFGVNDHNKEPYEKYGATVFPALFMAANEQNLSLDEFMKTKPQIDVFCRKQFLNFLLANDYNVVLFINDLEIVNSMNVDLLQIKRIKKEKRKLVFKSVFYFPIDSLPDAKQITELKTFDEIITYTQYAKDVIKATSEKEGDRVHVIPHAVDANEFFPISKEEIAEYKKERFGDKFVVGTVNRNSARKDIATTIMAFQEFKRINPELNTCLYLHLNVMDFYGLNIPHFVDRLGLKLGEDVLYPEFFSENKGIQSNELNKIYNCFDIFITNTTAEGWGLTVHEAMACKVPVICPMHTSLKEITDEGKLVHPITILEPVVFLNDAEKVRFKSNFNQTVATLDYLANELSVSNLEFVDYRIEDAYKKAISTNWSDISDQFWSIIKKHFK